jgi:plastocyanin
MRRLVTTIIVLAAIAVAAWAIGSLPQRSPRAELPSTTRSAEAPARTDQPPAERPLDEPVTVLVSITGSRFLPTAVMAQVGDTVRWTNEDTVAHTVTGGPFASARLAPGESYQAVVTEVGTVTYSCTLHPEMTGQVIVQPAR